MRNLFCKQTKIEQLHFLLWKLCYNMTHILSRSAKFSGMSSFSSYEAVSSYEKRFCSSLNELSEFLVTALVFTFYDYRHA